VIVKVRMGLLATALAVSSCLPSVRRLDEADIYEGSLFRLKVVRYHVSVPLSFQGVAAFVSCASAATRQRPGTSTSDPGWVQVRAVPAYYSKSAASLRESALSRITIVDDKVLLVSESVLQVSYDGCATFRRWDPGQLPDSLLTAPRLPPDCAPSGNADCSYLSRMIDVTYTDIHVDTLGHVSFTASSTRFPEDVDLRVESADSGKTWAERTLPPPSRSLALVETPTPPL
jgi:hypothetical protein